ncbi:magnesium transporter [Desulfuromonas acetoxidans]|uniref:Magnesium transporter MgtE n=1 Tax=Desulfuromonas acetoxidans (strain DSM 684 / 11070) TaxID=281689 RepID=Q1K049_DESA6|nr:magnesium transporter [Desulfuromonas acetoxidans]EAT15693.1 magnesium transporter [Desulfuromonas acetoxidans DSM 684]MBF0646956.1 magnesium transporter [Desulfuromonas acetoxidans]NVD26035.1 magnesium transporter [Desulfuromonas acetoxidans]NVE16949.1 magnesium transporter [Desulfuromonas acetoxidans]
MDQKVQMLLETVRKLIRRGAHPNLNNLLKKTHPADIAHLFRYLDLKEQRVLFHLVEDVDTAAEVLSEIEHSVSAQLLEQIEKETIVHVLQHMPYDDAVDIIQNMPEELAEEVLDSMQDDCSDEIEQLMQYQEDTAGGIMSTEIFSLREDITARQAIEALQEAEDVEMVFYLYVTDMYNHLVGVLSLRQLLMVPPGRCLRDIVSPDVISVRADTDQEEVAQLVAKYNILAIPVVDDHNKLLGIITVDDVIDVMRQEATEDIYKMAGASEEELMYGYKSFKIARLRLPWLLVNLLGGVVTGYLMWWFQLTLKEVIALISFIPVITGMGGNVGGQSATIVVRGFATGRIDFTTLRQVFFKELRVGLIMGLVCGLVVGGIAIVWHHNPYLGLVVGSAMTIAMTVAATMGVLAPAFFKRIGIDPAIASTPFVQTSNDITGILIYFGMATLFISNLH